MIVYLTDLKHRLNKPQQKGAGQGLRGTVTHRMKPPELQCDLLLLYVSELTWLCTAVQ